MTLEDLTYIFQPQIEEGTTRLYFILEDGDYKLVERCPIENMYELLPMLDSFQYSGTDARIPRFIK